MQPFEQFSSTYAQARERFLAAADVAGLTVSSYPHPLKGRDGETLAIDVALDGPADASKLLIISSGCHGVEGFCGSGVQLHALQDKAWKEVATAAGVAVLYVHAINPYGFSHIRRVTHENVDLNRNFQDFSKPLPMNLGYREVHRLLLPQSWPPGIGNMVSIGLHIATHGMKSLQAAVSGGQYEFADGLFFGGTEPTWSNLTLRQILRHHASHARQIAWIDLHTGLGKSGACERIFAGKSGDAAALARAREWWGGKGATPVKIVDDGTSVSAPATGLIWHIIYEECPQAEITPLCLEFGTLPKMQVLKALRAEQWLTLHPDAPVAQAAGIKRDLRDAFYVDTAVWKEKIVGQARQAMLQALSL